MPNPVHVCPRCQSPIPADAPGGICPACALLAAANPSEAMPGALGDAPTLEEVAAAFPALEVLQLIGHGGMGVVFQARQPRLDRVVALKILPRKLAAHPGFAERFTREARALARLAHPNIVTVYDFGESGGFFYLLMEFVNGVNLREAIRSGVTPEQALALVPKLCEALQFAHDKGVLHRDIKPENILLDTSGAVKLADFGIAKLAGDAAAGRGLTVSGSVLGTAAYMAPEQLEKPASVDHRADIYSLGVVFYEMLTGELPIGRFAAPSEKSTVNRGVDEVVFRALEKERERRQQSATEMRTQVEGLGASASRPAADRAALARAQTGRQLARAGLWLTLAPLGLFLLAALLGGKDRLGLSSPDQMFREHWATLLTAVVPATLAGLGGIITTVTALLGYRFRAPWFFWFVVLLAAAVVLVFNVVSVPGVLALGVLGYCLFYHREFFAGRPAAPPLSPVRENVWPRRVFWLLLLLIVLPLLLVVLARTYTVRERAATTHAELLADSVKRVVTSAQPPPFIVEFPRGSIELLAVNEHPSTGGLGWRMDGLPGLEGPFVNHGSKTDPDASQWAREFVFRTRDLPVDASPLRFEFEGSAALVGRGAPAAGSAPGQSLANHHLIVATFPRIQRAASIRIGAAFGPWQTLTQSTGVGSFGTTVRHERVEWKIAHSTPIESKDGRTIVSCTTSEWPDWEGRLVALTRDGKEVAASRVWMLNQQSDWSFADLPLGTVREFRFQARPRHWVEFRGIQLVPAAQQP